MPTILPIMSAFGLTLLTTISSTRLFFSSIMLVITICPYSMMNIYSIKDVVMPTM